RSPGGQAPRPEAAATALRETQFPACATSLGHREEEPVPARRTPPFQKRSSSKASRLRSMWYTARPSRAAKVARALPSPRCAAHFGFHFLARSLERRNKHAASANAQRGSALPIFLPPVPSFLPADSWAQRTSRAYDRNCPALSKRLA